MVDDVGDGMLQDRDTALSGEVHGCPRVYNMNILGELPGLKCHLPEDTAAAGAALKAARLTATERIGF
jgi:hypothetical protein